jgi:hypothetical protein
MTRIIVSNLLELKRGDGLVDEVAVAAEVHVGLARLRCQICYFDRMSPKIMQYTPLCAVNRWSLESES